MLSDRFRTVVESDMMGIMFWDANGAVYDANDAFLEMIGATRGALNAGSLLYAILTIALVYYARHLDTARPLQSIASPAPTATPPSATATPLPH